MKECVDPLVTRTIGDTFIACGCTLRSFIGVFVESVLRYGLPVSFTRSSLQNPRREREELARALDKRAQF
jgi:hypothetical protein